MVATMFLATCYLLFQVWRFLLMSFHRFHALEDHSFRALLRLPRTPCNHPQSSCTWFTDWPRDDRGLFGGVSIQFNPFNVNLIHKLNLNLMISRSKSKPNAIKSWCVYDLVLFLLKFHTRVATVHLFDGRWLPDVPSIASSRVPLTRAAVPKWVAAIPRAAPKAVLFRYVHWWMWYSQDKQVPCSTYIILYMYI